MTYADLLRSWAEASSAPKTATAYSVRLPLEAAARLEALAEMFPGRSREDIVTDLLCLALNGVAAALPYRAGARVIATDDHGDPVFEDVGLTPRFIELTRAHLQRLSAELASQAR